MSINTGQVQTAKEQYHWLAAWLAFAVPVVASGLIYSLTAGQGLTWRHGGEDGGDLATAVARLGVPHPTGYPLYILVGRLFLGLATDPARALNLASVFWGAFSAGLISWLVFRLNSRFSQPLEKKWQAPQSAISGIIAGLALAFAPLIWSQALITEVYAFNLALNALWLVTLALWQEKPVTKRLILVALVGGLAVGHHRTALFTVVAGVLFIAWEKLRKKAATQLVTRKPTANLLLPRQVLRLTLIVGIFALAILVPYLYILLRGGSEPASNWHNPGFNNLAGFWQEFSGSDYRSFLLAVPLSQSFSRLAATASLLLQQFGLIGLGLGLIGLAACWLDRTTRPLLGLISGGIILHIAFAATYAAENSQVYLIPAFALWAVVLGLGFSWLTANLPRNYRAITGLALILLAISVPLISLVANYNQLDLSRDRHADEWAKSRLETAPPDAVLVSYNDAATFALWYGQYVKNYRPDVAVVEGRLLATNWYRQNLARLYPNLKQASNAEVITNQNLEASRAYLARLNPDKIIIVILDFGF